MGYDCTLHVVDEALVREHFVPRLLRQSEEHRAFDERDDADELWARAREALVGEGQYGESPTATASIITQLAVAYCASELPNHYQRGFCLSLWPDQPGRLDAKVPKKLIGDPETLFEAVVAARPDLKRQFPKEITGNWCTGLYIPAGNVPELLSFVEKRVKRYPKPDQRLFRGLIQVLKHASEGGLGYWEGTDLPVVGGNMRPPESERRAGLEELHGPAGLHMVSRGEAGSVLVIGDGIHSASEADTAYATCDRWPPHIEVLRERVIHAVRSRAGRWLTVSVTPEEVRTDGPSPNRVRVADSPTGARTVLPPPDEREAGIHWAGFIGERVVAVLRPQTLPPDHKQYLPPVPLLEHEGRLLPIEELPEPPDLRVQSYDSPRAVYGAAHLNDGTDVFIWNGDGYGVREGRFEMVFPIGADMGGEPTVPWGPDGFLYLHYERPEPSRYIRTLRSARRGEAPAAHLPKHELVMRISPGPEDAILVKLGHNKKGDLGLLYFPGEEAYIRLEAELFGDEDPDDIDTLHWAPACGRLIALTDRRFWAIPIEAVLALPKHNARTGRQVKG